MLGLGESQRRAVALETGIQNSPLAFAIIVTSFPDALHARVLWLPLAYALFILFTATLATLIFRLRPAELASGPG